MLPLHSKDKNMTERKVATTPSAVAATSSPDAASSRTPSSSSFRIPLLSSSKPSSKARGSSSSSSRSSRSQSSQSSSRLRPFLVDAATAFLWAVFRLLDLALSVAGLAWSILTAHRKRRRRAPGRVAKTTKTTTVVVVGGNFAGLAALWELLAWRRKRGGGDDDDLRVVLIDRRAYSEYTPGILRLFCDPGRFWQLAQSLPDGTDPSSGCERLQGTVTSIAGDDGDPSKKVLTYVPESGDGEAPAPTRKLKYDYLILATGATYNAPISPATTATTTTTANANATLLDRYQEWQKAHERLKVSRRVLILGGGAVGVELAAEILDHDSDKVVTIVDAQPTLVPLFPASVGAYAEDWLSRKGAELRLGESLRSWNDRSCTLADGTVLHADVVYVCFGNRPNSEMVAAGPAPPREESKTGSPSTESERKPPFTLTKRRNVAVTDTLQLVLRNDGADGDGGGGEGSDEPCWFACGDVASPPSNDEKQAFQAEMQGKVAARNVIAMIESSSSRGTTRRRTAELLRYPEGIAGSDRIPLVFVLSLGRHDGVLGFNSLCVPGPVAAVVKWILEHTKVSQMRGRSLGHLVWKVGDAVTLFLSRTLFRSPAAAASTERPTGGGGGASEDTVSSASPVRQTATSHQRHQYRSLEEQLKVP